MSRQFVRSVFYWLADGCILVGDHLKPPRKKPASKVPKPAWYDEIK